MFNGLDSIIDDLILASDGDTNKIEKIIKGETKEDKNDKSTSIQQNKTS